MPGLVPGIHALAPKEDVDGRDKPGHDGCASGCTGESDTDKTKRPAEVAGRLRWMNCQAISRDREFRQSP
jgi:hypothetical protein